MAKVTITSLAVANFGPFRERQLLDLSVRGQRPVILVKALNGSGKTTLLTALQVCLYGQRALHTGRKSDYEQLVLALLRSDADGKHFVEVGLSVESAASRQEYLVRREWVRKGDGMAEELSVFTEGASRDLEFSLNWDDFIESILPAELVQLFFFDGEKIEALANPERLPDLLRRATEVFLGIGGIDALGNDLKAVERRAALKKNRSESSEFDTAQSQLLALEEQVAGLNQQMVELRREKASALNTVDISRSAMEKYTQKAQRKGLGAYESAARIKNSVVESRAKVDEARVGLAEVMSDASLPVLWLGDLWRRYEATWADEVHAKQSRQLAAEFKKRDGRLLRELSGTTSAETLAHLKELLAVDIKTYFGGQPRKAIGLQDANPEECASRAVQKQLELKRQLEAFERARRAADKAEQAIGEIPAEEQMAEILRDLQDYSKAVADAEVKLADIERKLAEAESHHQHLSVRLKAAQDRIGTEFRDKALEARSLEASVRARQALVVFKEKLLASKAQWLSEMITTEFRNLLRKKNLVARVVVDPNTYQVSIEDGKGKELPMERLSAGERQLLAISVLSALIKERKGRFPVVVDTPLARLDQQHRALLIRRFFATVSHQVVVLSTDQEVEGTSHDAMRPHTTSEYLLEYDDAKRRTAVMQVPVERTGVKEAA